MKVLQLKNIIASTAQKLQNDKTSKTNKFKSIAYWAIHGKISNKYSDKESITIKKINDLPISIGMKKILSDQLLSIKKTVIKKDNSSKLLNDLVNVLGIGNVKAKELISAGLKHIKQLKAKKYLAMLPDSVKIIINQKPLQSIPHNDIKKVEPQLINFSDAKHEIIIVGSYRRKKAHSRDIDIMISSSDVNALDWFLIKLKSKYAVFPYEKGLNKMSLIVKFPAGNYKLDVFCTNPKHKWAMLLYSTGSKEFNIKIRKIFRAKKEGKNRYKLNQKGLFVVSANGDIVREIKISSEKDFFTHANIDYISPENR